MPPHPTRVFVAPDAPIVLEAVPSDFDTESESNVMEIHQQMDAKKKLKENVKACIVELREKKQQEKTNQKMQEELGRERWEEEAQKQVDQKKQEDLKCLRKMIKSWWENKQAHWVDIDGVSSALCSMIQN